LKKLAARGLIAILFFNWYGYRLLTNYWQQQATRRLEARISLNDYDESTITAIKFPISSLAYNNPDTAWKRIDGEVIISDVAYHYIKRRIINDSLELLCLRNSEGTAIDKAGNEFFGKVNSFPNSKPSPQQDFQKLFSPEDHAPRLILPDPVETPQSTHLTPSTFAGHARRTERPPAVA